MAVGCLLMLLTGKIIFCLLWLMLSKIMLSKCVSKCKFCIKNELHAQI